MQKILYKSMTCYDSMRLAGHGVNAYHAAPPELCTSQVSVARQRAAVDRNSVKKAVQFTHFFAFRLQVLVVARVFAVIQVFCG